MYSASGLRVQYLKVWEKSNQKVRKKAADAVWRRMCPRALHCAALHIRRCTDCDSSYVVMQVDKWVRKLCKGGDFSVRI